MAVSPDVFIDTVTNIDNSSTPFLDAVHSILAVKHAFGRNLHEAQAKCIDDASMAVAAAVPVAAVAITLFSNCWAVQLGED